MAVALWEELAARHDGFIFDLFGVLHNGAEALPGAAELVQRLKGCLRDPGPYFPKVNICQPTSTNRN